MGYENTLFNGKSMRNAIIAKLSEDKHLTSALFANSNITILIDIISYMYQCLVSNLRQSASESMWSDTMFFENAARLAKLIGYYAKGQIPYTILGKLSSSNPIPEFGKVNFNYGPYDYDFAVVEHNVNNDQTLIRLALGQWEQYPEDFTSNGTKFQEFVIERDNNDSYDNPEFISQKYVRVFTGENLKDSSSWIEWKYSPDPLFLLQNPEYTDLNAETIELSRTLTVQDNKTRLYNFYIDENGNYILKFGDGLSTAIPPKGHHVIVKYVVSTETDKTISSAMKSAISNASSKPIVDAFPPDETIDQDNPVQCTPITPLSGYRDKDDADSIRINSRRSFSRQNRLVTKEDYRTYILENYPEWKDVVVQNNWEYISIFYGWLYAIAMSAGVDPEKLINVNNLQNFNSSDLADANNIYIWTLDKNDVDIENIVSPEIGIVGIRKDLSSGTENVGHSIGAIKDITENPIFLHALCKRFVPFAESKEKAKTIISYSGQNALNPSEYVSCFRIHVDSNYSNMLNIIKIKTYRLIKSYLFDNIMLGATPNIPALIKDLMSIDGIVNITTVFNQKTSGNDSGDIATEVEVNGMKFCTWTDTNDQLIQSREDVEVAYNLPNIPCFQYFKSTESYSDFIKNSIDFKIDYSVRNY